MGSVGGAIRARESRRLFQGAAATLASWHQDIAACSQLFRSGTGAATCLASFPWLLGPWP